MIFHNTKLINLWETAVSFFYLYCWLFLFPRREMQTTSRCASRTSASLGEGGLFYCTSFWNLHQPVFSMPGHTSHDEENHCDFCRLLGKFVVFENIIYSVGLWKDT